MSLLDRAGRMVPGSSHFVGEVFADADGRYDGCKDAHIVQIAQSDVRRRWWPDYVTRWHVDGGIPYGQEEVRRGSVWWDDDPGNGPRWYLVRQDFISCLVCFDDCRCGQPLGCVEWGHHWLGSKRSYYGERYIQASGPRMVVCFGSAVATPGGTSVSLPTMALIGGVPPLFMLTAGTALRAHCDAYHKGWYKPHEYWWEE
jgi:hypothetical protein